MTGAEIGAAGLVTSAGKEVAQRVMEEERSDRQAIRERAQDSPQMAKAAELYGRLLATKQAIVNKMWVPIAWAFGESRYLKDDFNEDLAKKLIDVREEDLVSPKLTVAVPLVQALSYSHEEPDLKEMYLNLLAAASTSSRAASVHPSFVEVIKQLSPEECRVLDLVLARGQIPVASIKRVRVVDQGFRTIERHVIDLTGANGKPVAELRISAWLDNWQRLGLIEIDFRNSLLGEHAYDWVKGRPEWETAQRTFPLAAEGEQGDRVDISKGIVTVTARGAEFYEAIGKPGSNDTSASGPTATYEPGSKPV